MNVELVVAGSLSLVAAAIHGGAGEVLVVTKLSPSALPSSPFGGGRMTKSMIRISWHLATIAFVTVGVSLLLAGTILHGDTARGIGFVAASASTAIAVLILGTGAASLPRSLAARDPRLLMHPAPLLVLAVAALAWTGVA